MNHSSFTNIAFISYKREDEKWAKWLQKKLEHYQLPIEVRKQNPDMEFAKRPRHVFKDTTDLSGGVLEKAIKEGLASSKYLIVICSPLAARSPWVCKEVQEFIDSGREENIIPFIIDGEPYSKDAEKECFPEALKELAGENFAQYLHFHTISQIHDNIEVTINYLPNNDCQVTFGKEK